MKVNHFLTCGASVRIIPARGGGSEASATDPTSSSGELRMYDGGGRLDTLLSN